MDKDFNELKKYLNWFCSNCMHPQEVGYCENNCYKKYLPKVEKELKALVNMRLLLLSYGIDDNDKLEKTLKALKIIKEKEVNVRFLKQMLQNKGWVKYETYQDYLRKDCEEFKRAYLSVSLFPLTQEEFNLLKEGIKNG